VAYCFLSPYIKMRCNKVHCISGVRPTHVDGAGIVAVGLIAFSCRKRGKYSLAAACI